MPYSLDSVERVMFVFESASNSLRDEQSRSEDNFSIAFSNNSLGNNLLICFYSIILENRSSSPCYVNDENSSTLCVLLCSLTACFEDMSLRSHSFSRHIHS